MLLLLDVRRQKNIITNKNNAIVTKEAFNLGAIYNECVSKKLPMIVNKVLTLEDKQAFVFKHAVELAQAFYIHIFQVIQSFECRKAICDNRLCRLDM